MAADTLNEQAIRAHLSSNRLKSVNLYEFVESTNDTLRELLQTGAEHGTLVVAESQTKGRGRFGRYFHSPAKSGIYLSFLMAADQLPTKDSSLLTIFVGTVVCRALRQLTGKTVQIKWINDLFLQNKKIGGILTEAVGNYFIIGIGLNIEAPQQAFPPEIASLAGCLYEHGEESISRNEIIGLIVSNLLDGGCQNKLIDEYKSYSAILGSAVTVTEGKSIYEAMALDIDLKGRLLVKKADASIAALCSGEVRIKC